MLELLINFFDLFQESAPWLLLGLLIAGLLNGLVPLDFLKRHTGKSNLNSVIKAALIGAPLPLCSCGVIPAALGLRRAGASKPATVSFLVATPETGVDSISVSYALLGPFMAIVRPVAAITSAIYVGVLTMLFADKRRVIEDKRQPVAAAKSCCAPTVEKAQKSVQANNSMQAEPSCCSKKSLVPTAEPLVIKLSQSLKFASGKLLSDITGWLILGLMLAAVIKTWLPTDFLSQWGDGFAAMLVMALIGVPMYICATASTPIAAGFLALGVSPGAVLVFMLAGPATNISTMGMVRQEMGNRVLLTYLVGIFSASISFGYLTNWLVAHFDFEIYRVAAGHHDMTGSYFHLLAAGLLGLLMIRNIIKSQIQVRQKQALNS